MMLGSLSSFLSPVTLAVTSAFPNHFSLSLSLSLEIVEPLDLTPVDSIIDSAAIICQTGETNVACSSYFLGDTSGRLFVAIFRLNNWMQSYDETSLRRVWHTEINTFAVNAAK